jgi:hypothetical protein
VEPAQHRKHAPLRLGGRQRQEPRERLPRAAGVVAVVSEELRCGARVAGSGALERRSADELLPGGNENADKMPTELQSVDRLECPEQGARVVRARLERDPEQVEPLRETLNNA